MVRATWEEARQGSIQTWKRLAGLLDRGDVGEFRRQFDAGWPLCMRSKKEIEALGVPKVEMFECDFCRGNLDYGGCGEYVERVTAAVAAGDLAQAQKEIGHVLEAFEAMRFDVA